MSFWNILFAVILLIIWIIGGGFITESSVNLTSYKDKDSFLNRAYWSAFWAAFITWTLVIIFIILVILAIVGVGALFGSGAGEAAEAGELAESTEGANNSLLRKYSKSSKPSKSRQGIPWFTILFLVVALVLVGVTGVLAAITANDIRQSPNYSTLDVNLQKAYDSAIIAACLCLGSGGLLIIGIITYFIVGIVRSNNSKREIHNKSE